MKLFKYMDKILLFVTLLLFAFGTVMVFSASNVSSYMRYSDTPYFYLTRQLAVLFVSLLVALFVILLNVKTTSRLASLVTYALIVSLFLLFVFGRITNHAQSWFKLGPINLQPSEFFKVAMIIWAARYYDAKKNNLDSYGTALYPLFIVLIAVGAIVLQPDLGTALIVLMIFAFIFIITPIDKTIKSKIYMLFSIIAVLGILIIISFGKSFLSDTQMSRITSVISSDSPCSEEKYYTDGNQVCNGYIAINNGGLTGRGLGKSIQKYLYLPESHTDFIICIIIEELGLIAGIGLLVLYIIVLARIVIIGRHAKNNRDAIICYAGAFYIFIHIVVNLLGVFGVIPMTGVPLPFMSYGGSYTLSLVILLSVVQRICFETRIKDAYS